MDLKHIEGCVEGHLDLFERKFSECLPEREGTLGRLSEYVTKKKGKRLRPLVALLVAEACGGVCDATFRSALILELLHTASLVHDDVIDESELRRGAATVNSKWDNRTAILLGDYIYGRCLRMIETKEDFKLLGIYAKIAMELPKGEILQKDASEASNYDEDSYFEIIDGKTASLFGASAYLGAKTAKGEKDYSTWAEEFGRLLGRAFQIKDDILDLSLDCSTGKPCANDIREKKITLPLIYLLNEVSAEKKEQILAFISQDKKSEADIHLLISHLHTTDCILRAEKEVQRYSREAMQALQSLPQNDYRKKLEDLTELLVLRNS